MHITIMKIKNHKKLTKSLFQIIFFLKYNYMNKIFHKIHLKFDFKCFHSIVFRILLLCCHQTKE